MNIATMIVNFKEWARARDQEASAQHQNLDTHEEDVVDLKGNDLGAAGSFGYGNESRTPKEGQQQRNTEDEEGEEDFWREKP